MNKMKTGFLITARMKSTRLPGKLLLEVEGKQIIRWMIDRIKLAKRIDEIIICTSTNPQDDILVDIAAEENINVFRGHETDVIQRLYDASIAFELDYALNITADCPLVSFEYIDKTVAEYQHSNPDLIKALDLPHGFFSYGLKIEAMKKVCDIKKDLETEVWGRYFTDTGLFKVLNLIIPKDLVRQDYRLTLDYPDDFTFFKKVYAHFGQETYKKGILEIIEYLDHNPDIVNINKDCKKLFQERWDSQNKLKI